METAPLKAAEALADLARLLDASHVDVVPDGWLTAQQWAESSGRTWETVRRLLRRGVASGHVETKKFRLRTEMSGVRPVVHYRMVAQ